MADPLHWAKEMGDLFPAADVRKMMGGNMFDLLGLTPQATDPRPPKRITRIGEGQIAPWNQHLGR
jgi:hypothetical protein